MNLQINVKVTTEATLKKLESLLNPRPFLREVAFDVLNLMTERIHEKGQAADGSAIGTYSPLYLRYRSLNGRGSDASVRATFTRQLEKSLGVLGTEKGWAIGIQIMGRNPTNNYLNRSNPAKKAKGSKRVPMVTRSKGKKTPLTNADLIKKLEQQYKRKIWALTKEEKLYATNKLQQLVNKAIQ